MVQSLQHGYNRVLNTLLLFYNWVSFTLEGKKIKGNIDALDGVRAIACLSVATLHITLITTRDIRLWDPRSAPALLSSIAFAGDTGVTLFFILSGFLLFLPYAKSLLFDDAAWPSVRRFYLRRALRILPLYYLSLILIVIIYRPSYLRPDHLKQWFFFITMFMDSSATTYKQLNGPFWTLAVEWQFYLLLPWLALGISWLVKRGSLKKRFITLTLCLSVVITWGILTRCLGLYLTSNPNSSILLPRSIMNYIILFIYGPTIGGLHGKFLEDFAVGMFISSLYIMARNLPPEHVFFAQMKKAAPWLLVFGLALLVGMAMWKYNATTRHNTWSIFNPLNGDDYTIFGEFGFALGYGLFVTAVLYGKEWLQRIFTWQPLRWIGIVSFGIYMWHLILLEGFTSTVATLPKDHHILYYGIYWLGFFVIIVPFSFLLFVLVEKPFMNLGKKI